MIESAAKSGEGVNTPKGKPREAFNAEIKEMDDDALERRTSDLVWLSAFASNNPNAPAHWQVDDCYDEFHDRNLQWRYQRAWNKAYRLAGHEPSEYDVAAAQPPEVGS